MSAPDALYVCVHCGPLPPGLVPSRSYPATGGREFRIPRDAADYVMELPIAEQDLEEWQAAVESLLVVVERDGPTMLARIGITRAFQPRLRSGGLIQRARTRIGKA